MSGGVRAAPSCAATQKVHVWLRRGVSGWDVPPQRMGNTCGTTPAGVVKGRGQIGLGAAHVRVCALLCVKAEANNSAQSQVPAESTICSRLHGRQCTALPAMARTCQPEAQCGHALGRRVPAALRSLAEVPAEQRVGGPRGRQRLQKARVALAGISSYQLEWARYSQRAPLAARVCTPVAKVAAAGDHGKGILVDALVDLRGYDLHRREPGGGAWAGGRKPSTACLLHT